MILKSIFKCIINIVHKPLSIEQKSAVLNKVMKLIALKIPTNTIKEILYLGSFNYNDSLLNSIKQDMLISNIMTNRFICDIKKDIVEVYLIKDTSMKEFVIMVYDPFELLESEKLIEFFQLPTSIDLSQIDVKYIFS